MHQIVYTSIQNIRTHLVGSCISCHFFRHFRTHASHDEGLLGMISRIETETFVSVLLKNDGKCCKEKRKTTSFDHDLLVETNCGIDMRELSEMGVEGDEVGGWDGVK